MASIKQNPIYKLYPDGEFCIGNYNFSKPFANFFPGIAGTYGIPIWVFYVNRGQGIVSFGTKDKDHAIMEFLPANKAWQLASTHGFRTFLKITRRGSAIFYEPFQNSCAYPQFITRSVMRIRAYGLTIEEHNATLGISTRIEYFTIPNEPFGALARILTITNTSRSAQRIQLLDGLPQLVPFGTTNWFLKKMSRTIEAWMTVNNLKYSAPFYRLAVDPSDKPEVTHIREGNFYLSFFEQNSAVRLITPVVDPETIFGPVTDFSYPHNFIQNRAIRSGPAYNVAGKTPCAFSYRSLLLPGKTATKIYSLCGYMRDLATLNAHRLRIAKPEFIGRKQTENKRIIEHLQQDIDTKSSSPEFNLYARQTYLDNILRGGYPTVLKNGLVFYQYARKHGDLERDYNRFYIQPTYYSQGDGNYRDINQNRRSDCWFHPEVKDDNIIEFVSLIQADGFNPLVVKGIYFTVTRMRELLIHLGQLLGVKPLAKLQAFLQKPFTPGELVLFLQEEGIDLPLTCDEFLALVLNHAQKHSSAEHGEGFWTDHWTYILDLIEGFLTQYPEKLEELVFKKRVFTFYDNAESVRPRSEKYLLYRGQPRQLHSVATDAVKRRLIHRRRYAPHSARTDHGKGEIYSTTLINKLLCLAVNKLASLDPFGVGIEMEANKPNWFDSLNGLPALFGSSLNETFELKRLIAFIQEALKSGQAADITLTQEIAQFLRQLSRLLSEHEADDTANKKFIFWDRSSTLKENYRQDVKLGFEGTEVEVSREELLVFCGRAIKKLTAGINRAKDKKSQVYYSYFINRITAYRIIQDNRLKPTRFQQHKLPIFLEGQVHALRIAATKQQARKIALATKNSPLYDRKLNMYKVTASLQSMPEEIGRCRVFPAGWLENESIWMHMAYKYLLELLKSGLYAEFYAEFKKALVCFQPPKRYGRSVLENSSFIVSSAFPDKKLHGNGFVARLSGSTAEFIQIWLIMNIGKKPFSLNERNELTLRFQPSLTGELFDKKGVYAFNFLSKIRVTYYNPKHKNTYGNNGARVRRIHFTDKKGLPVEIQGDLIPSPYALHIRNRQISSLTMYLE